MKSRVRHLIRYPAMFVEGCLVVHDEQFSDWYLYTYIPYIHYIYTYIYIYIWRFPIMCLWSCLSCCLHLIPYGFPMDGLWTPYWLSIDPLQTQHAVPNILPIPVHMCTYMYVIFIYIYIYMYVCLYNYI